MPGRMHSIIRVQDKALWNPPPTFNTFDFRYAILDLRIEVARTHVSRYASLVTCHVFFSSTTGYSAKNQNL